MSSTITVAQVLSWISAFIVQRPTTGVGGVTFQPGLMSSNKVLQTITGPPFKWNWNRIEDTYQTVQNVSDSVPVLIANFGYLEKATAYLASADPQTIELEVYQVLAKDTKPGIPQKIAPLYDDGKGNITFRLLPSPNDEYTIYLTMQKSAPLLTDTAGTWAPIPDRYAYLYEQGLRAEMKGMYSEQAYALEIQMFFRQLVGACEGLNETERAIFLEDRMRDVRAQIAAAQGTQQGMAVRV